MKKRRGCSQRFTLQRVSATAALLLAFVGSTAPAVAQDPRTPEPVGSIPDYAILSGQSASVDLTPFFSDADGDALAYAATVSDVAIAAVSVSGNILTIAGLAPGTAIVTVFASDPGGLTATQRTQVTVARANGPPEPVGTIPAQTLAAGQWVSISLSSYFRDPNGEPLSFSATTSDAGVAGVEVSGDIVTITQTGTGTVIVNAVARDPGGLSVQQSITVAAGSDGVAPPWARREPGRPGPVQRERAQPGAPTVDEADGGAQSTIEARQPGPFPPRQLASFVESTGYTLAQGRGHVSAGYLGANPLAQTAELGDFVPAAGQASYGVTDDITLTAGSGFYYNVNASGSDLFPYFAPKFRAWHNDQVSVAVTGYLGLWLAASDTVTYYGGSVAGSMAVNDALSLHASGGMLGISATIFGEAANGKTDNKRIGVAAVGGNFHISPEWGLSGEFRRVGTEDGTNILTASLRFLQTAIAGELGLAYYLEANAEIRPIVSVAYRF